MENKLAAEELKDVSGGRQFEIVGYCKDLYDKYGIARGDIDSLLKVCTEDERAKYYRLKAQAVRDAIPIIFKIKKEEP